MFDKETRYVTGGIDERVPQELQCLIWASIEARIFFADGKIDYLQVFTFKKLDEEILNEKIYVIDDGDHSTMLFAYEY